MQNRVNKSSTKLAASIHTKSLRLEIKFKTSISVRIITAKRS